MNSTPSNILGPFYRGPSTGYEYSPDRVALSPPGTTGDELEFNFAVRSTTGAAIGGYWIEIWHADANGIYDLSNPRPPDAPQEFWPNTAFYRTNRYIYNAKLRSVWSIVPRPYFDSSIGVSREPHLHVIIRAPGRLPLTTQVFLPRNAGLPPSADPYYQPANTLSPYIRVNNVSIGYFVFYL